jgi:uncharacterized protein YggE
MMKKMMLVVAISVLYVGAAYAAGAKVVVEGRGAGSFTPRKVSVSMTVRSADPKAAVSASTNASKVAALHGALQGLAAVGPKNVKLGQPSTSPTFDNNGNRTGFETNQSVSVTAKAKAHEVVGQVFDVGADHGATASVSPIISPVAREGALQRAEVQAVKNAAKRAGRIAGALGQKVTAVEGSGSAGEGFQPVPMAALRMVAPATQGGDVGKQVVSVTRPVTFGVEAK